MRLQPVRSGAGFDLDGHWQVQRVVHAFFDEEPGLIDFFGRESEEEFVVNLEEHAGFEADLTERVGRFHNGKLGGRAP